MSDDIDTEFSDDSDGIKQLREHAKANAKALKEAQERLAAFEARERESAVKSVLTARGLSEKVAKFYDGEASEDAVSKWLDENAELFGGKPAGDGAPPAGAPPVVDPNAQAAARLAAASGGRSLGIEAALGETGKVYGDPNKLMELIRGGAPYQTLVDLGLMPNPKFDPNHRPTDRD